jgi:hypothetical protein
MVAAHGERRTTAWADKKSMCACNGSEGGGKVQKRAEEDDWPGEVEQWMLHERLKQRLKANGVAK